MNCLESKHFLMNLKTQVPVNVLGNQYTPAIGGLGVADITLCC